MQTLQTLQFLQTYRPLTSRPPDSFSPSRQLDLRMHLQNHTTGSQGPFSSLRRVLNQISQFNITLPFFFSFLAPKLMITPRASLSSRSAATTRSRSAPSPAFCARVPTRASSGSTRTATSTRRPRPARATCTACASALRWATWTSSRCRSLRGWTRCSSKVRVMARQCGEIALRS